MDDALFDVLPTSGAITATEVAQPTPRSGLANWSILHAALTALNDADFTRPTDESFVAVATSVPVTEWTARVIEHAHNLLTGVYRPALEEAGWDVDLFPAPAPAPAVVQQRPSNVPVKTPASGTPQRPQAPVRVPAAAPQAAPASAPERPAAAATGPASVITITATANGEVALAAPVGHPARSAAKALPGSRWNGQDETWIYPINHETAHALRGFLTGHKCAIAPDVAALLRAAADAPAGPAVTLNGDRIEIRFTHTADRQDDVKRLAKGKWDGPKGCWYTEAENAAGVIKFAQAHNLAVSHDVEAANEARFAPFDYDHTIDGLRGVPVRELGFVRAQKARGKTPSLEARLKEFGIESVYDLLSTIPRRYMDRSTQTPIRNLKVGDEVGFLARVTNVGQYDRAKRMVRITVADQTGEVQVTFFNSAWMAFRFRVKDEVVVYGRLDVWTGGGRSVKQMTNPIMDPVGDDTARIVPVYPQSEKSKVTTWDIHGAAMEAVRRLGDLQDPLPEDVKGKHNLISRLDAYRQAHHPDTVDIAAQARHRLAFDELFRMQLALGMKRHATADETGVTHNPTGVLTSQFLAGLRFQLTGAQQRALGEVREDLLRPYPMHRLLQGDVGAGKSAVAMLTLLSGVEGGYQGALLAPTEILATQLFAELRDELAKIEHPDGRPLIVDFLGGKTRVKEKRRILAGLADGSIDLAVGTHALLTDEVEFANLGVVVIDEQHRFGVEQRAAMRAKGINGTPDVLIMTATPIPRTQAISSYGDLTISVLDELPPGRTPIATTWLQGEPELDTLTGPPWDLVRSEVEKGRQAYVVASLVEDNEKIAAASAEAALEALEAGALAGLRLGLVHGKQHRDEREATMQAFKRHELDVLVATTVIEVGVNVPNATVMVVLDATRFGIAQLHQIRGRVGRGQHASSCILTGKAGSQDAVLRMKALCDSTDGFYLAEVDLSLRGMGSIFGTRQSGQSDLRVADLRDDKDLLELCREEATKVLDPDPKLLRRPGLRNEVMAALGDEAQEWLSKS